MEKDDAEIVRQLFAKLQEERSKNRDFLERLRLMERKNFITDDDTLHLSEASTKTFQSSSAFVEYERLKRSSADDEQMMILIAACEFEYITGSKYDPLDPGKIFVNPDTIQSGL